jgi:uncharacterized protein YdaU (DUF1376 family)
MRRNWMPLYIPDFLADTVHLSAAETGAYLCLIMDYWLHDGLPDDDHKLAAIARLPLRSWRQMRPTIQAFFHDGWLHNRIDAELGKMIISAHRRQAAGSKGGTVSSIRRSNASSNASSKATSNASSNRAAIVQHSTQERILNTFSDAARDPAPQQESGSATKPAEKPQIATGSLAEVIAAKGWVQP